MNTKQVVETVFRGRDKLSRNFTSMGRNADKFGNGAERAFRKASKSANRFKGITSSILKASAVQKGLGLLSDGVRSVTDDFLGFDDALFSATAKFNDIDLSTKKGQKQFEQLGKSARKAGQTTIFNATQSAEALNFLALAGFDAKNAMAALPSLTRFATASEIDDLGRAVDIATDSLGAFGMASKNAATLQKNLTRVSDVFAKTQSSSNQTVEELFEAIKNGASVLETTGQSLATFAALSGIMANSAKKAGEAGTNLRNVMLRLSDPPKQARKALRALGVQVEDENGNFRDIIDIIADFEKGLKGMGTRQKSAALSTIFGAKAITGMTILLKTGSKGLKAYRKRVDESAGASEKMAKIMERSVTKKLLALKSAATEVGFKLLDAFKVKGVNGITSLTNAIRGFDPMPIITGISEMAKTMKDLLIVARSILTIMTPLITAFAAYRAVVISMGVLVPIVKALASGHLLLTLSLKATAAAQWLLNIAMSANPIGLIIAGVAALGVGIFLLVKKWSTVKNALVNGAMAVWRIFKSLGSMISGILSSGGGALFESLFGDDKKPAAGASAGAGGSKGFTPPNRTEANAANQSFSGVMEFINAPKDAKFSSKSRGAPLISVEGLGTN